MSLRQSVDVRSNDVDKIAQIAREATELINQGILIESCVSKVNGKTTYYEPVVQGFTPANVDKTRQLAEGYLKQLNTFFKERNSFYEEQFESTEIVKEDVQREYEEPDTQINDDDDLPF